MSDSVPSHAIFSRKMGPDALPNMEVVNRNALASAMITGYGIQKCLCVKIPVLLKPNWLQITLASLVPNLELHTVPHALFMHTSTRPRVTFSPPTNRTSPSLQFPALVVGSIH